MTILKSSLFSLVAKLLETVLNMGLLFILARLLDPKDFGVFAIVLAVQALLQPLVDMGLGPAYIKARKPSQELKNVFFTLNLLLGVFNFLVLLVLAPIISVIYSNKILLPITFTYAVTVLFTSISRQTNVQLMRAKRFDSLMKVSLFANTITFMISVYFAYQNFGVWVLVIKAMVLNLFTMIFMFYYERPNYKIVGVSTIRLFIQELKFGFEIFINRILNGVFNASDKFFFGKFFSVELLGNYSNAQQIARMIDTQIRTPITVAVYTHLERYSGKDKKRSYDKLAALVFLVTSMFSGLLILEGDLFLHYFLGEKWLYAAQYIRPLGFFSMAMVMKGIYTLISMAEGDMRVQNIKTVIAILLLAIVFGICHIYGMDTNKFVVIFSLFMFVYWGGLLILEISKYSVLDGVFLKSFVVIFLIIGVLFFCRNLMGDHLKQVFIISVIYEMILFILLFYGVRRKYEGNS